MSFGFSGPKWGTAQSPSVQSRRSGRIGRYSMRDERRTVQYTRKRLTVREKRGPLKAGEGTYFVWWVVRTHSAILELSLTHGLRVLCFPYRRDGERVITEAEEARTRSTIFSADSLSRV